MSDFFTPTRLRGQGYRANRFTIPVGTPSQPDDEGGGGGLFGLGIGPDINLGIGTALRELGQGVTGLAALVAPGSKEGEPGWKDLGKGLASSVAGTGINAMELTGALPALDLITPLDDTADDLRGAVGEQLGSTPEEEEALTPLPLWEQVQDRGLLPVAIENVGNVSIVAGAATAPVRAGSVAARMAGRSELAARLTAIHKGLIEQPLIHAAQHPYRTAGSVLRERVIQPASARSLAAQGIVDQPPHLLPIEYLASELPDTGVDYQRVKVDMDEHAARAEAYRGLPDDDPEAHAAYSSFRDEINEQYRHLTEDLGVNVEVVDEDPYPSYVEMLADLRDNKTLKVLRTEEDAHPFLTPEENDRFRAVHDAYGHGATGRDFGRHGEEAAFLAHRSMFGDEAGEAMATETRGQNAVLIDEGEFGPQKVGLLPPELTDPTAAVANFQRRAPRFGDDTLARIERRLKERDSQRQLREQNRLAESERRIAARSAAVRQQVAVARDHLIDKAKEQGVTISRREASVMVGDEVRSRMTGVKALEEEYLARGVTEADMVRLGIRERFIPAELRTPELEAELVRAVDAEIGERQAARQILESSRKGSAGLPDEGAMEATPTKIEAAKLRRAQRLLDRAESEVLDRKEARERASREKYAGALEDKLGRIADQARRADETIEQAVEEFDASRTWTPRAWRGAGAMEESAQAIYDQTLASVAENNGEWGGATFNPHSGQFVTGGSGPGYALGLVPGTALKVPVEEFSPAHIEHVIRAYQDVYQHPATTVGTWVEDGEVYIDPGEIVPTREEALIRGAARRQLAVYDIGANDTVAGILKDRPDIGQAFLDRSTHLRRRAKQLRDVVKRTNMTDADADHFLDILMRQAVKATDDGRVKHPDEFFRDHVRRIEFAKKRSERPGTLGQIVLERSIAGKPEREALWKEMVANVKDVDKVRRWYHDSHDLVERLFRNQPDVTLLDGTKINPADLMYQIVAITSFQAMPRDNWTRAMQVFQKFDDLPRKEMRELTTALKKVTSGKATLEEAFGLTDLPKRFAGGGLYAAPKQYLAELFAGRTIDKWTPEHLAEAKETFGVGSVPDRAKAVEFIQDNYPGLIDRIGEDAAVKEFWSRQHRAKIINFWDNLQDPARSLGVTMDQQMERLFGEEMPISQSKAGRDGWIRYSEQVRDMADELSEALGERILPHELQAVMWVFAKEEIGRIQMGHFNALAHEAVELVKSGTPLADDLDPISDWIDEAGEPYYTVAAEKAARKDTQAANKLLPKDERTPAPKVTQRMVKTHKVERAGKVAEEEVVYRPGWGAGSAEKKVELFDKRRAKWLAARNEINTSLAEGDIDNAVRLVNRFVKDMQSKAPRSLGLADDAAGADFFDIWMKGEFHSKGYKKAAAELDRLDVNPGELPPLLQSFKDKVLGEFVPMDDGTRGIIRVFEDGNLATLVHENGHLLRRVLNDGEMRAVEKAYGIKRGAWDVAAEERFANDLLNFMTTSKAPAGLGTTFQRVREALSEIWQMVAGTFQRRRVHPELAEVFDAWLSPAERPLSTDPVPGLPTKADEGTLAQRVTRPPRFPEPPAKKGDYYQSGRKGMKALAKVEKMAARKRELSKAAAQTQKTLDDVRTVLAEGRLPSNLERNALRAEAQKLMDGVNESLGRPSTTRVPARWQPLWEATQTIAKEAESNPELAAALSGLPETLHEIQQLAIQKGFDPVHVRDFTPAQVRRLVFGSMRLGLGRDVLHEVSAGTRKSRSGVLARAGGVDRSIEAFMAATVEAVAERRTNEVVTWVEKNVARKIDKGQVIPAGWSLWDPMRSYLLTGQDVSEAVVRETAGTQAMIVPDPVMKTLQRYSKDYDHWAFNAIRKVTSPWRTLVLTLSPGWYTRNVVGNIMLATAEGASLKDWRAAWHSYRRKDEIGRFADLPWVTSDTLAQEAGVMADGSLIPRKGYRESVAEGGKVRGSAQYAARKLLRVNEVVDEFARAAVYHHGRRLNMTPELAMHRAKEALVDYGALSPFEREAVRAVIPFYAWQKGILKVVTNQVLDHPARASVLMQLGQMQDEYIADRFGLEPEDVPDYYKHLVGNRNLRSFNPFADPSEIVTVDGITRSMNPFIELGIRKGLGAPEFAGDDRRLGFFGQAQQDVNVPSELGSMLTHSPGGKILGEGPGPGMLGLAPVDDATLRSRFLRSRRLVRGIPNPETGQSSSNPFLPPRLQ